MKQLREALVQKGFEATPEKRQTYRQCPICGKMVKRGRCRTCASADEEMSDLSKMADWILENEQYLELDE
uniref:Uncharacterized protein n=1 Tax=viral metagenome TaxID=1070528 RepID=A0A6M3K8W0_9ZZZZ